MTFLIEMIKLGLGNLRRHMLRSFLTALGIILGVGAVITMVSIGEGSKLAALAELERLGAKNIIIRSQKPPESQQQQGGQRRSFINKFGLTRQDARVLADALPGLEAIVPLKSVGSQILRDDRRKVSQAFGTTPGLATVANLTIARGRYLSTEDAEDRSMVAVVGAEVARTLYPFEDPLGANLRIDEKVFKIIGVLAPIGYAGGAGAAQVGRDMNLDVHLPVSTAESVFGDTVVRRESGSFQASQVEISEIYLAAPSREEVIAYAGLAQRAIAVRHPELKDIEVVVPFELLQKARADALRWNMVLGSIASISLLIGGIGIMNIMLASVTERTREIGIRRALGATRNHIVQQFLIETGVLSTLGGLVGVGLGIGASVLLRLAMHGRLPTQVTLWSILVAFAVAAATGLVFGLYPALKASRQDPIVALRHD